MPTARRLLSLAVIAPALSLASSPAASADGPLTVSKLPAAGAGTVIGDTYNYTNGTWTADVVNCGDDCTHPMSLVPYCYDADPDPGVPDIVCDEVPALVRLRAVAGDGWAPGAWNGCTSMAAGYCHVSSSEAANVTVTFNDVQPPSGVSVTLPPLTDGKLAGRLWTFKASAADNWGIRRVELLIDGRRIATSETAPYTFNLDSGAFSESTTSIDVSVRAVDLADRETVTAVTTVPVDIAPPKLTISGPGTEPGTSERRPRFQFTIDDAVAATVQCSVDSETAFDACESPVAHRLRDPVADGIHILRVRAADARGNVRTQPHAFRVDTTAPDTAITGGRTNGARTNETDASFTFAASESARFECRLDGGAFTSCRSPHATGTLPPGTHNLSVRAIDAVGNVDPSPATLTWTIVADLDGDGFNLGLDCNDEDATIHPGAPDIPENGRDEDCDGVDPPVLDRDRDGFNRPQDCDDSNARINPGARDTPGDAVDDDCDGTPAPWPRLRTQMRLEFQYWGRLTQIVSLRLTDAVRGTAVTVTCMGRACPFKTRRLTVTRDGKVDLTRLFKRRRLPPGTRIDVAVRHAEAVGPWVRYVTKAEAVPRRTERCLMPGVTRPGAC